MTAAGNVTYEPGKSGWLTFYRKSLLTLAQSNHAILWALH